jgi:hypothetical protein
VGTVGLVSAPAGTVDSPDRPRSLVSAIPNLQE